MSEDPRLLDGAIPPSRNVRLFGHAKTAAFLANAYATGQLHHALLLEGAQGIGKATLAFRLANHVLSHPDPEQAPSAMTDPDPDSSVNRQIASGASHNLIHLTRPVDQKTGRMRTAITVDEVRRVGRFLAQTSGTGNWRIVIVDPADDLNRSAANAILKMLEEPPRNALFILVSHLPGRLLATIRSRCMPVRMLPLGLDEMKAGLEHLGVDRGQDEAILDAVIRLSEGSLANALLLLRYGGLEIAEIFEQIMAKGPLGSRETVYKLADSLSARDRDMAFTFFGDHAVEWLARSARTEADSGNLARADRLAWLTQKIREDLATADIYNLDRKQVVASVFSSIFQVQAA